MATGVGFDVLQRCKRLPESGTVLFTDDELVRDGWVLFCNQLQRTTNPKSPNTREIDVGARTKYEEGPWTVALTAVDKLQDKSTRKAALQTLLNTCPGAFFFSLTALHTGHVTNKQVCYDTQRVLSPKAF